MTKVVTFGAFVEILPGVEGLVHISELAQHHVENPREVVSQGPGCQRQDHRDRRGAPPLSLSLKRVEDQNMPMGDLGDQIEAAGQAAEEVETVTQEEDEADEGSTPNSPGDGWWARCPPRSRSPRSRPRRPRSP